MLNFFTVHCITTERLDNIQIDKSNNYFREKTEEEITKNKVDEPLICLQRDNQSKKFQKKEEFKTLIH